MTTMPAPQMMSDINKLSFAKVAASASKDGGSGSRKAVQAATTKGNVEPKTTTPRTSSNKMTTEVGTQARESSAGEVAQITTTDQAADSKVVQGLKDLKLEVKPPSLVVNGSGSTSTEQSSRAGNSQTPSDDVSQKADSGSELGTKPPSLDGKSITSGTTFNVLDEKESLRPDDSASVKAAADEDDAFSIRGSLMNSRMGSDVAGRFRSIQIGDMPPRAIVPHVLPSTHVRGTLTPESGASEQPPAPNGTIPLTTAPVNQEAFNGFYSQNPDEKLLEAMKSPKDRLFLLRLEKEVIDFVQDSKEPFMDLPPSNSFCRLLTHKLADYYHMTHSFEAVASAVRIYRTPFCRVPPSLQSIAAANDSSSSTPPPALLPKKIMRRGEEGDSAPVSAGPSKPTSEDGSDSKDKGPLVKEKMTREEREEAYNKARQRIFGTPASAEAFSPDNEDSTGVSRASSVSAKDKSLLGKRAKTGKQRRDDSESFDSRSQYTPFYPHPAQPMWAPHYVPVGNGATQFNSQLQPQPSYAPVYGQPPSQQYPPTMVPGSNGFVPHYNPPAVTTPAAAQASATRYPPQAQQMPGYTAPPDQGTPPQTWQQPPFNSSQGQQYQTRPPSSGPPSSAQNPGAPGIPYAYGQLPVHSNPHDLKSQHPIPGSYNRHAFNPKTQSFVPGTGMAPMASGPAVPPVALPFGGPSQPQPTPGAIVSAPPPMPYGPPVVAHPHHPPYVGNVGGFGMMRQGSNNALPPQYHHISQTQPPPGAVPHQHQHQHHQHPHPHQHQHQHPHPHAPLPHASQTHPHQIHHQSPRAPNKPVMVQGSSSSGPTFSHLPNYGNPATLPQKPST